MRVYDAILGCLNQAVPGGVAGAGQAGIISVSAVDRRSGRRHVSVVEPFIGGSGGRSRADGLDGIDQPVAFLRSAPAETVEIETDLVVRRFAYAPGSAAPGRHRGGLAMRIELENRGLPATVTVRGQDRFRLQPWGAAGGVNGSAGSTTMTDASGTRDIGRIDVLDLPTGATLRMVTPSGGGLLSVAAAETDYRVVLAPDGAVDPVATAALRAGLPREDPTMNFALGPARMTLESHWPPAASAALATGVMAAPSQVRAFLVDRLRANLAGAPGPITPAQVTAALAAALAAD
jgi:N-methylhydantoinase B